MVQKSRIKNDLILMAVLLVTICVISVFLCFMNRDFSELEVEISVDGETVYTFPLGEDSKYNMELQLETGNYLVIENGFVYLKDADCPDKLCVRQGKISEVGQSIICLPHRLIIKINGHRENSSGGLDVIQ